MLTLQRLCLLCPLFRPLLPNINEGNHCCDYGGCDEGHTDSEGPMNGTDPSTSECGEHYNKREYQPHRGAKAVSMNNMLFKCLAM